MFATGNNNNGPVLDEKIRADINGRYFLVEIWKLMHEPLASVYGVCMPTIDNKHEEFSFQISIPRIDVDLVTQLQLGCLQPVQPPDWQYRWLAHILLKKICNLSPLLFKIAIWLYLM